MTYVIMSNKLNLSTTLHVTGDCDLVIAGNSSVSNIALSDEVLSGAYINHISWACAPGAYIKLIRGSSLVGVYDSSSFHEYAGCGMPLNVNSEKPLTIRFFNGSGFCTLELQKVVTPIVSTTPDYILSLDFINQSFYAGQQ